MRRLPFALLAAVLLAGYGVYAYRGAMATLGMERASAADDEDDWVAAIAAFRSAAVGSQRAPGLREAAERSLDLWEDQVNLGGHTAGDPAVLETAIAEYLRCLCAAPASRRPWGGMSEVYEYFEWADRERRAGVAVSPADSPWAAIGRHGRVSIGLARLAAERAPTWYAVRDALARRLWRFGARDAALDAVAQSAHALPIYAKHAFDDQDRHGPVFLDAFTRASWEVVGTTPLVHRVDHLIDLGKLELRRKNPESAIEAFERALETGGDRLNRAEAQINLGVALLMLERTDEAAARFRQAMEHPVYEAASLSSLAMIAEREGDARLAMTTLRRLRRLDPSNVEYCLRFADAARRVDELPAALESLRWARMRHPDDARVLRALGETQLDAGDRAGARQTLVELSRIATGAAEFDRLRAAIEESSSRR